MACSHPNKQPVPKLTEQNICQCENCGLFFVEYNLKRQNIKNIYRNYYNEAGGRFFWGAEYIVRFFRFLRACKIYLIYPNAKSIFDIGCGRGYMLYYLKKYFKFPTAVGTQISKPALEFSRKKLGLTVFGDDMLKIDFGDQYFDVISMYHVFEHLIEPEMYLEKIYKLLNPGGKLIIEMPNFNSWTKKLTNAYWLARDPDHHIYFFTPAVIKNLLSKYGYKVKKMRTFSLEYSAFTSAQSLLNRLTRSDNIFYLALQTKKINYTTILHAIFFFMLLPVCFTINILLYFSPSGENINIIAEK